MNNVLNHLINLEYPHYQKGDSSAASESLALSARIFQEVDKSFTRHQPPSSKKGDTSSASDEAIIPSPQGDDPFKRLLILGYSRNRPLPKLPPPAKKKY